MRVSYIAVATLALASTSLAAPLKRDFAGAIQRVKAAVGNATLPGIAGAVVQSIENPKLTAARLQVVKALATTQSSLSQIATQAQATGNSGVTGLVATGQTGLTSARQGVDNIGASIASGATPSKTDQKNVAIGIKGVRDAMNQMAAAITTPDPTLSSDIAKGQSNANDLQNGGQGVLSASGLTFADLGLPDNFATS